MLSLILFETVLLASAYHSEVLMLNVIGPSLYFHKLWKYDACRRMG